MQERDRADALGSWDNVPRGVAEDLPAQATLTVRPSMGTAESEAACSQRPRSMPRRASLPSR